MSGKSKPLARGGMTAVERQGRAQKEVAILRRLFAYTGKIWRLSEQFDCCTDLRRRPRLDSPRVVRSAYVTVAARLGSLNAFEGCRQGAWLRNWIGGDAPS